MQKSTFKGNFTQQEPIPEQAIAAAVKVMQSGRLHRYNVDADEWGETALLEQEFAHLIGSRYCLACTSGGYAMHIALRAWGLETGAPVLTNAFTLSPVPGAIHNAGGLPILVESNRDLVIDLHDLEKKIDSSGARILMLSHMRGHLVDMQQLTALLDRHSVTLIEDCAHTMGAFWDGKPSGSFGVAACFSTQTYKHINSGEGGLLVSNDDKLIARATILSGSYMLYERHLSGPDAQAYAQIKYETPNMSGRMDNLRAAILRPQLETLADNCLRWNERHDTLAAELRASKRIYLPRRNSRETYVGSSLQFLVDQITSSEATQFLQAARERGVELKWFGADEPTGYTSKYNSWRYFETSPQPQTEQIMQGLFDLRLPLTFSVADCTLIGRIIVDVLADLPASAGSVPA